jgi:hypothetical protein
MRRDHSGQWEQAIEKLSRFIAELDVDRDHLCFPTKPFYCGAVEDKNLRYRDGNIRSRDRRALHRRFSLMPNRVRWRLAVLFDGGN